jgi:uridine kinase
LTELAIMLASKLRALRSALARLFEPGGCRRFRAAIFDHVTDMPVPLDEREALPSSILLFDGTFLHRPELLRYWDASIFLRVDFAVSVARYAARDRSPTDPATLANRRYVEGQRTYLRACEPEAKATLVIDNNDLSAPTLVAKLIACIGPRDVGEADAPCLPHEGD